MQGKTFLHCLVLVAVVHTVPARSVRNRARSTYGRAATKSAPPPPVPPPPYWFDTRIHNLGNAGMLGGFHAAIAPFCTYLIDRFAYKGIDARSQILRTIAPTLSVVDLCCGVAFSVNKGATGVDTSPQMLAIARLFRPDATFFEGNAESWGENASLDVATIMYGMHEMPRDARRRVLHNAMRIARKYVLIVDIDPGFNPSQLMLSGEPYLEDYLMHMDDDVKEAATRAWRKTRVNIVPGHVIMWRLDL